MFRRIIPTWRPQDSHSAEVIDVEDENHPNRRRTHRSASESRIYDNEDLADSRTEVISRRTDSKRSNSRRGSNSDPLGLTLVNTKNIQHPDGDIIFVHGVGGTSLRSWSYDRDPDYFWPPWLSSELELSRFRIFTYGYNANVKGSQPVVNITDFARDLLLRMLTYATGYDKDSQPIGTYPIIFVSHSMGGLVTKKAYILGKHDDQYQRIISHVFGMVFLSTPHKGSQDAKMLNTILTTFPFASSKIYIAEMTTGSLTLQDINDQFRNQCSGLKLVSFFETKTTSLRVGPHRIIVDRDSAVLGYPREQTAALDADHHSISKFKNPEDPNYVLVAKMLKWLASTSKAQRAPSKLQRVPTSIIVGHLEAVLGIQTDPKDDLLSIRSKLAPGSCQWISKRVDFIQWTEKSESDQSPRMFYLTGLPATGKSAVASYVVRYLQRKFEKECCQYHFFASGDQMKRTGTYILRSIAFQIAQVNSDFRGKLFELYETETVVFEQQKLLTIWEKIFQGILFKMDIGQPLFWVLDGMDETDSSDQLLRLFNKFESKTLVKIFFVSRPSASLQLTMSREDTFGDIKSYVQDTVKKALRLDNQTQTEIVDQILKKANGSFLWVGLALEELAQNWHTKADIKRAISGMPQGMEPMYSKMIKSVAKQSERNREMAARILTWTACSYRPLRISELKAALELEFSSLLNLEETIAQICGHLVRVHHTEVTLIHETARNYLSHLENLLPLSIEGPQGHDYLALTCIQYLSDDRWKPRFKQASEQLSRTKRTKEDRKKQVASLGEEYAFLYYALFNFSYHVSKSNSSSPEVLTALFHFLDRYSLSWINGVALSGKLHQIVHAAQYLKAYAKKRSQSRSHAPPTSLTIEDVSFLHLWAMDFIQLVGHFGKNLLHTPTAIYRRIPPFCPRDSMIAKEYQKRGDKDLLSVVGLSMTWNDCLARVIVSEDQTVSRVLSTEQYFLTLISVSGIVVVWSSDTFKEMGRMLHREFVTTLALNKSATMLVTAGAHTVKIWQISTMTEMYSILRPFLSRTMTITFGAVDTEVLGARDDCNIICYDLQTGCINWSFVAAEPEDDDRNCPRTMVFSPHQSYIAIAFSGKPVTVWELSKREKQTPRRCILAKDSHNTAQSVFATPLVICWEPEGNSILILYHNSTLVRWHILDDDQEEFSHISAREMTISEDGNLLMTSDYKGSISVWAFPHFHLVYQLNQEDLVRDISFSPDAQRFYDLRGSMCHVWEPDALVRSDDVESDNMSISGASIMLEPVIHQDDDIKGHITALACDEAGVYICCGKDDGSVAIHNMSDGKRARKVYSHSLASSVIKLAWSSSGRYIISVDDSSRLICKRIDRRDNKWAVFRVFNDIRVDSSVNQFLFNEEKKMLLISTNSMDILYDLKAKEEKCRRHWRDGHGRRWSSHPKDKSLLIWIGETETYVFTWSKLELLETPRQSQMTPAPRRFSEQYGDYVGLQSPSILSPLEKPGLIQWVRVSSDSRHLIYSVVRDTAHSISSPKSAPQLFKLSITKLDHPDLDEPLREAITPLPSNMRRVIGCSRDQIAFLDDDFHFCTWKIGTAVESAKWHFFVPRDWLSPMALQLARVNQQGNFLCPKNGEVAIVRLN